MCESCQQDATKPENMSAFHTLPRPVQLGLTGLLVVAVALGVILSSTQTPTLTNPGATLPNVGDRLAALPLTDAEGKPFDMETLRGRPVWINIWASWCPPCKAEMPDLEAAYRQARERSPDLVLLSLNAADSRDDGVKFYHDLRLTSTLAFNNGTREIGPYRVFNFPTQILVDRDGVVRAVLQKSVDRAVTEQELRKILR